MDDHLLGPRCAAAPLYMQAPECSLPIKKNSHANLLLKTPSLPANDLNTYRPTSNLSFIYKVFKKVV